MGLQQNLNDIQTNLLSAKTAIAQSISNKGVECSADDQLSSFAEKIDSISGGGTGEKFVVPDGMKFGYSTSFDPTMFDVSNVTDMSYMFYSAVTTNRTIDFSNWDVSNVTTTYYMFNYAYNFTNINLSNWNTTKFESINSMFYGCERLKEIDLSTWNTNNIKNLGFLFYNCKKITTIDLSSFDLANVTNMTNMFYNCTALTNLQLPDLGHNEGCTTLDLSTCLTLTKDSILYLFNNAFDRSAAGYTTAFTIKLNAATKALLSDDELTIATNKGFTVV